MDELDSGDFSKSHNEAEFPLSTQLYRNWICTQKQTIQSSRSQEMYRYDTFDEIKYSEETFKTAAESYYIRFEVWNFSPKCAQSLML